MEIVLEEPLMILHQVLGQLLKGKDVLGVFEKVFLWLYYN